MKLKLEVSEHAEEDVRELSEKSRSRLIEAFHMLARSPQPEGSRVLRGSTFLRVLPIGKVRVIYSVDESLREVRILTVYALGRRDHDSIWQKPKIRALLAQPLGAPIELTREEAIAVAREAFGKRPDLPSGKEYVRRLKPIWKGLLKKQHG